MGVSYQFDPARGRMRKVRTGRVLGNHAGDRFMVGTIVQSVETGSRGVVSRLVRQIVAEVAWAVDPLSFACTTTEEHLDDLRAIGQATSLHGPYCEGETEFECGTWVGGATRYAVVHAAQLGRVGRWADEARQITKLLRKPTTPDRDVPAMEARLVKLDHLMEIYGSLGRRR
jgi:hypothetical protein